MPQTFGDGVLGASNLDDGILGASNLDDGVLGASDLEDGILGASNLKDLGLMVLWWTSSEGAGLTFAAGEGDDHFGRVAGPMVGYLRILKRNQANRSSKAAGNGSSLTFVDEIELTFYCR